MVTRGSARRSSRAPSGDGAGGLGLGERGLGELVGDAVLVDGDERDRARRGGVAEAGDDAGARQAVAAALADLLGLDQLALAGAGAVAGRDLPVAVGALVDGGDAAAGLARVVDADDPPRPHADAADDPGGERGVGAVERQSCARAGGRRRRGAGSSRRARTRMRGAAPSASHSAGSAQRSPSASAPVTRSTSTGGRSPCGRTRRRLLLEQAVAAICGEELLQLDLGRALQPEGAGDVALGGLAGLSRRKARISSGVGRRFMAPPLARGRGRRQSQRTWPGRPTKCLKLSHRDPWPRLSAEPRSDLMRKTPRPAVKNGRNAMNAPLREPSFRESVDLMFNRAVRLMDLSPGLEEKIRVCNSTYTVRFGVRLRGAIHTFTGYRSVHSEHMEPVKGGIRYAMSRAPGRGRGAGGADDLQVQPRGGALRRLQGRPPHRPARVERARDGADHPPLRLRALQARPHQPQPERPRPRHGHRRARDGLDRRPVPADEHHRHQRLRLRHRQAA